ncbi:unnamed protein product [Alopecurus aequalis]
MTGLEEGSSKQRKTKIMAAKAGDECVLNQCQHGPMEERTLMLCTTKRKAETAAAGDEKMHTIRRKTDDLDRSVSEQGSKTAAAVEAKQEEEEAHALKGHNPDLVPSPEEETDEELVGLFAGARLFYAIGERFSNFQAWVRSQYGKQGYVEVDDDFLANRAEVQAWNDEAREEALKEFDFSDMDDDMKSVFLRF